MALTIHLDTVSLDAGEYGSLHVMSNCSWRRCPFVRSKYHLSALTGHHTLSSFIDDSAEIGFKRISTVLLFAVWFLAMKSGLGIKRTPSLSQRICPGAVERACNVLRLWPEASATRNDVLMVKSINDALAKGSKGCLAKASNTLGRLQEGNSLLIGGRFRKNARNSFVRAGALETNVPSSKPL